MKSIIKKLIVFVKRLLRPVITRTPLRSLLYSQPIANRTGSIDDNVEWNKQRWGQQAGWKKHDGYGYRWGGGFQHTASSVAQFFDLNLRPYLNNRYDLKVLEISPGAGRSTVEILRYANKLTLVDLNEVAIDTCKDRLKYYPGLVEFFVNDGKSLACVSHQEFDLIVSFDSLVHVHPDIVKGYLEQSAALLLPGGLIWFDTSGKGERALGHRSDVTSEQMARWARKLNLEIVNQVNRNDWDCISILRKPQELSYVNAV